MGSRAPCLCVNIALKWVPVAPKAAILTQPPAWLVGCLPRLPRKRVCKRVFPGVVQFDLPIGVTLNQSCVREPSVTQAAIGCSGKDLASWGGSTILSCDWCIIIFFPSGCPKDLILSSFMRCSLNFSNRYPYFFLLFTFLCTMCCGDNSTHKNQGYLVCILTSS